jgi:hypothetical protein
MHKILLAFGALFFAAAVGLFSFAAATPASADAQYSANGQYTRVADVSLRLDVAGGDRVCCKRGWRDWWSTRRECRRAGGYQVANRECRDDHANYRVCCKRGRHDWWSTLRECRRAGGYQVANWQCRND